MTRSGHCYTPSKTAQYESKIAWCFQQAAPDHVPIKTAGHHGGERLHADPGVVVQEEGRGSEERRHPAHNQA
ncbi:MAG TPA: hypothetical protein PLD73_01550 [Candidatus Hydrogenedentes bacterium]|nr:hypothetical protein [Candidatus Hydrogenedentota bacterium]